MPEIFKIVNILALFKKNSKENNLFVLASPRCACNLCIFILKVKYFFWFFRSKRNTNSNVFLFFVCSRHSR